MIILYQRWLINLFFLLAKYGILDLQYGGYYWNKKIWKFCHGYALHTYTWKMICLIWTISLFWVMNEKKSIPGISNLIFLPSGWIEWKLISTGLHQILKLTFKKKSDHPSQPLHILLLLIIAYHNYRNVNNEVTNMKATKFPWSIVEPTYPSLTLVGLKSRLQYFGNEGITSRPTWVGSWGKCSWDIPLCGTRQ